MAKVDRTIALATIEIANSAETPKWDASNPKTEMFIAEGSRSHYGGGEKVITLPDAWRVMSRQASRCPERMCDRKSRRGTHKCVRHGHPQSLCLPILRIMPRTMRQSPFLVNVPARFSLTQVPIPDESLGVLET